MADVVARGVRFNVQRLGAGEELLVCLHGLVFDNLSSWYFTAASRLAKRYSVLLYDLRGHGLSEQPPTGYTLADMADDLAGILDAVGEERPVHLVGNSYGAAIALVFARRHPGRVRSLVLVDGQVADEGFGPRISSTLGLEGEERDRKVMELFGDWLERHRVGDGLDRDAADFDRMFARARSRRRKPMLGVAERLVHETSLAADVEGTPPLGPAELAGIRCPVLALYGEESELRPQGEAVAAALPGCRLVIVPAAEHFVLLHQPGFMCDQIEAWVDAHGGRP